MNSPASVAAKKVEAIKKIPLPTLETYEPDQLVAAAAEYAKAALKVHEAEKAIERIKAGQLEREKRMELIQATLDAIAEFSEEPMDVWCCTYTEKLGGVVKTMDVPGYWTDEEDDPTLRTATLYSNTSRQKTVEYAERSFNIAPGGAGYPEHGALTPSEGMTDAAIFYNAAMEPGHLRWKPIWRYGVLLTDNDFHRSTDTATVQLEDREARGWEGMDIDGDEDKIMTNVPISYPPCHGDVFGAGDEVLVLFEGQARNQPKIIGFRREPRPCPDRSWIQIV